MMIPENVLNLLPKTVDSGENILTHARHDWNGMIKYARMHEEAYSEGMIAMLANTVERYCKGMLNILDRTPNTQRKDEGHDLFELVEALNARLPGFLPTKPWERKEAKRTIIALDRYYFTARYEENIFPDYDEFKNAYDTAKKIVTFIENKIQEMNRDLEKFNKQAEIEQKAGEEQPDFPS